MSAGVFVDFIGIGFRRCASSWLHAVLSEHPEIIKPPKGLHYFSDDSVFARGRSWYEGAIADGGLAKAGRAIRGEASVSYGYPENFEKCGRRIHEAYPNVKLICTVRNPVERAYSEYLRLLYLGQLSPSVEFLAAVESDPRYYIEQGKYARILAFYRELFGNSLRVFFFDDLRTRPEQFVSQVYAFIGAKADFVPSIVLEARGRALPVRSRIFQQIMLRTKRAIVAGGRAVGAERHVSSLRASKASHWLSGLNRREKEEIPKAVYAQLLKEFNEDIDALSTLTGRDLGGWLSKSGALL